MGELANCSRCGDVFVKDIRSICRKCFKEEERVFDIVYQFLSKRKNREATIAEIVEATKVEEFLIIKFMRENRLRVSQFPNLAYPCESCHTDIVEGKRCKYCSERLIKDLANENNIVESQESEDLNHVYYVYGRHKK